MSMNRKTFVDPPPALRSVPFWSLNDELEPAEVERQMEAFHAGGFGGAYLHSRIGLLTEYLGAGWWEAMDAGVKAAQRLGIEAWFYDEDKWPSGFAGGKVPLMSEDFHARSLMRLDKGVQLTPDDTVLAENDRFVYVCHKTSLGKPWFNGTCWVDLMNPEMVKAFIDCSYVPYAQRYAGQIGKAVQGIFTDEPQISPRTEDRPDERPHRGMISYSPGIRDAFRAEHGYDFVDHVASLFEDVGDFRTVRLHYYRTIARRFEESFSKQIGEYCAKTGMVWTGHYNAEESLRSVKTNVGDMMCHYRHMQRPGIDHLGLRIAGGLNAARSLSSVANQYGQERRLSEMFGISGQNMNFEDRKWIADWHAVLGINHVCPHLSLYSMKGCRKRDFPPTISPQQPYWPYNGAVEDYMARVCYATTVGSYAPELLVVHPLESDFLEPAAPNSWSSDRGEKYYHVLDVLQAAHRDYDLGDEQILADVGDVVDQVLRVGKMEYRAAVLPYMATIRRTTLQLLERLAAAGGRILAVGELPTLVDAREDADALARLARIAQVVPVERLAVDLAEQVPPAVRVEGKAAEHVWIQRRVAEGGQLVLLTNTSRLEVADVTVHLPGDVSRPVLWDPASGRSFSLRGRAGGGFQLHLHEAQTLIVTTGRLSRQAKNEGTYQRLGRGKTLAEIAGAWDGKRLDPNAITLDFARCSTDGGQTFGEPEPVLGIHERFTRDRWSGPLALAFEVQIDQVPARCALVLEQPGMYRGINVNGQPVSFTDTAFYRDHAFRRQDVTGLLRTGTNTIELRVDYVHPVPDSLNARERYGTEIESIYLVGEFGVQAERSPEPPAPTQRNQQGALPQRPVHRFRRFRIGGEATRFEGDLSPQGYPFYAGRFELTQAFEMPEPDSGKRYFLTFPAIEAVVVVATLNGQELPPVAWSPWEVEITGALRAGRNELTLTVVNSMRNLLGPHHHRDGELTSVGPESFGGRSTWTGGGPGDAEWYDLRRTGQTKIWRDDYHHIPLGLLEPPRIVVRARAK